MILNVVDAIQMNKNLNRIAIALEEILRMVKDLDRIAIALERLADILEKKEITVVTR